MLLPRYDVKGRPRSLVSISSPGLGEMVCKGRFDERLRLPPSQCCGCYFAMLAHDLAWRLSGHEQAYFCHESVPRTTCIIHTDITFIVQQEKSLRHEKIFSGTGYAEVRVPRSLSLSAECSTDMSRKESRCGLRPVQDTDLNEPSHEPNGLPTRDESCRLEHFRGFFKMGQPWCEA